MSAPTSSVPGAPGRRRRRARSRSATAGQELDEREVDRDRAAARRAGPRGSSPATLAERGDVAVLADERLRHAHAGEPLLEVGVDARCGRGPGRRPCRWLRNHSVAITSGGTTSSDRAPARRSQHEQDDATPTNVTSADERVDAAGLERAGRQRVDVGGHAGHDPPGHLAVVVVEPRAAAGGRRSGSAARAAAVRPCRPVTSVSPQ